MREISSAPDISKLALAHVAGLKAYTPGMQPRGEGWVKLNTNECPYPPSPRVAEALRREIGEDGGSLRLYPDPTSGPRRAPRRGRAARPRAENVCVGNGSDDLLNLLVRCFCGRGSGGLHPAELFALSGARRHPERRGRAVEFDRSMRLPVEKIAGFAGPGCFS